MEARPPFFGGVFWHVFIKPAKGEGKRTSRLLSIGSRRHQLVDYLWRYMNALLSSHRCAYLLTFPQEFFSHLPPFTHNFQWEHVVMCWFQHHVLLQVSNLRLQERNKVWIEAVDGVSFIAFPHWSDVHFCFKKQKCKPCIQCIDWNKPMNSYYILLKKWWCEVLQMHDNLQHPQISPGHN